MEFEQIVSDIFKEAEYEVSGIDCSCPFDISANKEGKKYFIEVKFANYRDKVPLSLYSKAVSRLIDASNMSGATPVLVVSCILNDDDRNFLKKNEQIQIIDISNLLFAVAENEEISNRLISFLPFSVIDVIPQKCFLKIETLQHSAFAESLLKKLELINAGRKEFGKYEDVCKEILKYIFEDDLSLWQSQAKSNEDLYRFDCLCRIKNNNDKEFWSILEKYFNTKYIVFEFKNYTEKITQKEIYTTERYLYAKALRRVAIIIAKNGFDNNSVWAAKGCLRENGKLMILLDAEDLRKMCEIKMHDDDPSGYLLEKLDALLLELEK